MHARVAFAAFVAFWACITTLLVLSVMIPEAEGPERVPRPQLRKIDARTLGQHDRFEDCWMAIEGKVYDFTAYLPRHPTSRSVVEPWCGREATEGMRTKGRGRDHSPAAWALMEDYRIGVYRPDAP